jgi:fibronectin-binding autotransporter adhesin
VRRSQLVLAAMLLSLAFAISPPTARAAFTVAGDVAPATDPAAWKGSTDVFVGETSGGTLTADIGSRLYSKNAYIAHNSGSTGLVTVSGPAATWQNNNQLYVGNGGNGTLSISNGGTVTSELGSIGVEPGSTGVVNVDGPSMLSTSVWLSIGERGNGTLSISNGGTVSSAWYVAVGEETGSTGEIHFGPGDGPSGGGLLACTTLLVSPSQLSGTGSISTGGLVSDFDLVLDSTFSAMPVVRLNDAGRDISIRCFQGADPSGQAYASWGAGWRGKGSLTISQGFQLGSSYGYIGLGVGSTGDVTISGTAAKWIVANDLYVGKKGVGTLVIADHAAANSGVTYLGALEGSTGIVNVIGTGSTWSNRGIYVGNYGAGMLRITSGGSVTSSGTSSIGCCPGARGDVVVDGTGSTWQQKATLYIGGDQANDGTGTLSIVNGGSVTTGGNTSYIGFHTGSAGTATVNGIGSNWTAGSLQIGYSGKGTLRIANGGSITVFSAASVRNSQSLLAIDVAGGSKLNITSSTGLFTNNGLVRISAGPGTAAGPYTPILARSWSGAGAYQFLGGVWDAIAHEFTVSDLVTASAGNFVTIDNLVATQRMLIRDDGDNGTGWSLGTSFAATSTPTSLSLMAAAITGDPLADLEGLLGPGGSVLGAWDLVPGEGYTQGDPVYLSFGVGSHQPWDRLQVWHFDGEEWTRFDARDLTYDGTFASFTATRFSAYAVAVPEPGTLVLLSVGFLTLLSRARRKSR